MDAAYKPLIRLILGVVFLVNMLLDALYNAPVILNIYKPKGCTSFNIVARARKQLGIKKIGHAGTLDPLAEGVLVLLTDKDTKKQEELMKLPKKYYFEAILGAVTPSGDLESEPTLHVLPGQTIINKKLPEILNKYTGEFEQTAPAFSAKKFKGKPLYKLARAGKIAQDFELPKKQITIYEFHFIGLDKGQITINSEPVDLLVLRASIFCSSGTYVRSLIMDLGADLGCGAVAQKIVRTIVGPYTIEDATRLEDLKA